MNRFLLALAVPLAAAGFLLAACGSAAPHAAGPPPRGSVNRQALVVLQRLARCARAHGLPAFPDPVVRSNGVPVFPDNAPRVPPSTQQACHSIVAQLPPSYTETQPVSAADFQKLLALARCIREHGIPDWPDPNPLGEFPIDQQIQRGGKRLFVSAVQACARLNPDPSGGVNVVQARP